MSSMTFVDTVTHVPAGWANDVDALVYDIFNGAQNLAQARTALGVGSLSNQSATNVAITGGSLDGVTIGSTTPSVGVFSSLDVTVVPSSPTDVTNKAYVDASVAGITGTLGTMAQQNANGVDITAGDINGTTIGTTSPAVGVFSSLSLSANPTLAQHVTNKAYVDNLISALPVFGTLATQNANNVTLSGGIIDGIVIGGVVRANAAFLDVQLNRISNSGLLSLDGTDVSGVGFYAETSVANPDARFKLESGGVFSVFSEANTPLLRIFEGTGRILINGAVDNGTDELQLPGGIASSRVLLSSPITLALQAASKSYVDTQIGGVPTTITSMINAFNATLGDMSQQDAANVAITGGSLDGTVIGGVTPAAGSFTTINAGSLSSATYSLLTLNGSGSAVPGTALMLKSVSNLLPNVSVELGLNGALVVKGGALPAMQVKDNGRVLVNLNADDGISNLQVGGDVAIDGVVRFNGPVSTGASVPTLGTAGPMTVLTPTWVTVRIGSSLAVVPAWIL